MVDGVKKLSDIALQSITLSGIVLAHDTNHLRNFLHSFVRSFAYTTRKRIGNKGWFKYGI